MKVIRKCLCVCLALIVSLSVYKSNSAFAEMHGVAQQQKIDSGNAFYCTYDKITETVFFLIKGNNAVSYIYSFTKEGKMKKRSKLWNSEVRSMIAGNGCLYYTVKHKLGPNADLFEIDLATGKQRRILSNEIVYDIKAAGNGNILIVFDGYTTEQHAGLWCYSIDKQIFSRPEFLDYTLLRIGEDGVSLKNADNMWSYFDFASAEIHEINFCSSNYVDICNNAYWTEMIPGSYNLTVFLNGKVIYQVDGYEGISKNKYHIIWYKRQNSSQILNVMDIEEPNIASQIRTYEIVTTSNVYLFEHYAAMLSDGKTQEVSLLNLKTGDMKQIRP